MAFHSIKSLHKLTRITSAADSSVSSHGEEPDNQTKYKAPSQYLFSSSWKLLMTNHRPLFFLQKVSPFAKGPSRSSAKDLMEHPFLKKYDDNSGTNLASYFIDAWSLFATLKNLSDYRIYENHGTD
ncbi:hypothetical protein HID58_043768 [Brassica napus]|uniref:Non-specific serine/threonine protein kinase n=1 Tax=Brassica napus TaxID=3708 RepID=A0ABQ8BHF9_BRANA|nr:hypothetical protein HID58_043768 [Brassica napus]